MICTYCHAANHADDHRCVRCGRRMTEHGSRHSAIPFQASAAAPQLATDYEPEQARKSSAGPQLVDPKSREDRQVPSVAGEKTAAQPSLFGPMEVPRTEAGRTSRFEVPLQPAGPTRRRMARSGQQALDFDAAARLSVSVEPMVYCDASAAPAPDRVFAAVVDTLIPLAGFAVFLVTCRLSAGTWMFDSAALPFHAGAFLLGIFFYRAVCCLGDMDTPGIRFAGLRVLNFDGRRPGRRARFFRMVGGLVSLFSLGIGLVWSLLDEEQLTWHDHMSRTFPTRRMY